MKIKRVRAYLSRAVPRTIDEKYLRFLDMRHILGAPTYAFGEVINNAKSRLISYRTWQSLGKLTRAARHTHPQTSTDGDELCRSFPNVFGPLACWTACCYKTRRRRLRLSWILVTGPRSSFPPDALYFLYHACEGKTASKLFEFTYAGYIYSDRFARFPF